jgi:hypothetical protein
VGMQSEAFEGTARSRLLRTDNPRSLEDCKSAGLGTVAAPKPTVLMVSVAQYTDATHLSASGPYTRLLPAAEHDGSCLKLSAHSGHCSSTNDWLQLWRRHQQSMSW